MNHHSKPHHYQTDMKETESTIQQNCYMWLTNNHGLVSHNPRLYMFSIPNETAMSIRSVLLSLGLNIKLVDQAVALIIRRNKNTGFRSGIADTVVLFPGKTVYVEFKTPTGYQSEYQIEFQNTVERLNQRYYLCRSLEQFKSIVEYELNN